MALSSTDPQQFADRIALVDTVMDVQSQTMDRLSTEKASLTALEDHLSALRADSADKKKQAEAALARAQSARDAAAKAKADLDALAATQTGAGQRPSPASSPPRRPASPRCRPSRTGCTRSSCSARPRPAGRRPPAVPRRARSTRAAAAVAAAAAAPRSHGYLSRPVKTGWVSSEFGMRFHPILHYWRLHSGRDYAVPCGTPVYAAASGTIISAGWGGGYGNRVVIDHGYVSGVGLATTYNHLTRFVRTGGHVRRGQLIAYSGTTGLVDRLPPALRDAGERQLRRPPQVALTPDLPGNSVGRGAPAG